MKTPTAIQAQLPDGLRQAAVYSGHESFPLRFTWLTKSVRACISDGHVFGRSDAMVRLGVGKNMVRSMRHWAIVSGVVTSAADKISKRSPPLIPTELGLFLFGEQGRDPYMEDPATVWLVHWLLASNPKLASWNWFFNECRATEFDKPYLLRELARVNERPGGKLVAEETITRDVDCLIRTYVPSDPDKRLSREELLDCPLTELGIVRRAGAEDTCSFVRGRHDSLPAAVFAHCLCEFWSRVAATATTMSFDQVAFAAGSPGRVFLLSEAGLVDRLFELDALTDGAFAFGETAGLRQVYKRREARPQSLLRKHYGRKAVREVSHAATV